MCHRYYTVINKLKFEDLALTNFGIFLKPTKTDPIQLKQICKLLKIRYREFSQFIKLLYYSAHNNIYK